MCVLRRRMGAGNRACSPITTTSAGYRLDLAAVTIDLHECRSMLALAAGADDAEALALTRGALRLCEQPLLASEMRADWADLARREFHHELAAACGRASRAALALGEPGTAVQLASRATNLEPYDEGLTRDLMRALSADGRRAGALRAFLELRRALVEELGVEPGPQTRALYVQLLTDDAAAGPEAVPSRVELRGPRRAAARDPGADAGRRHGCGGPGPRPGGRTGPRPALTSGSAERRASCPCPSGAWPERAILLETFGRDRAPRGPHCAGERPAGG